MPVPQSIFHIQFYFIAITTCGVHAVISIYIEETDSEMFKLLQGHTGKQLAEPAFRPRSS